MSDANKEKWLGELSEFIVEANKNTWAAEGVEVFPERPGYKELAYQKGEWDYRDSYTGYFRAPGMTTIYQHGNPVWTMQYGGHGQSESAYDQVKETFTFLKNALMAVKNTLPIRGPEEYVEGNKKYTFNLLDGDLTDGIWKEEITENGLLTFTQSGLVGIVIPKNKDRKPILPWYLA